VSRGVGDNAACVHAGFLVSYNSVRSVVLRAVREQLAAFPGYIVVLTGMLSYSRSTHLERLTVANRTFIGRCSRVPGGPLRQVEFPVGGRPAIYFWCVCFFYVDVKRYLSVSPAGQPRTGDAGFADFLESIVGRDSIFRGKGYPAFLCHVYLTYILNLKSRPYLGYVCVLL